MQQQVGPSPPPPSFWLTQVERVDRPPLAGDTDADVCIVGAGYTGLWTAYHLAMAMPSLRVVVLEAEHVGFGASGRNGGWASAKLAGLDRMLADPGARDGARRLQFALYDSLDRMAATIEDEAIACDLAMSGAVTAATRPAHVGHLQRAIAVKRAAGFGEEHVRWLEPDEASQVIRTSRMHGASFTPHCAVVHPAKLVMGLAAACERRGVVIHEGTPGRPGQGRVVTPGGSVSAATVIMAGEAYAIRKRDAIPVYSLMVATEPLSESTWAEIGLGDRPAFSDGRHLIIYGQRTADGRIAFGGRGAPYHYRSRIAPEFDCDPGVFRFLRHTLEDLFPALAGVGIEAEWGGPLAIPRDWRPAVRFDPRTGLGSAGGYVGQGVAAAHLAGETLRDLVLGADTDLVTLPWVGHRSPRWEPEPLRWVGVNLGRVLTQSIDHSEDAGRSPRLRRAVLARLPIG